MFNRFFFCCNFKFNVFSYDFFFSFRLERAYLFVDGIGVKFGFPFQASVLLPIPVIHEPAVEVRFLLGISPEVYTVEVCAQFEVVP